MMTDQSRQPNIECVLDGLTTTRFKCLQFIKPSTHWSQYIRSAITKLPAFHTHKTLAMSDCQHLYTTCSTYNQLKVNYFSKLNYYRNRMCHSFISQTDWNLFCSNVHAHISCSNRVNLVSYLFITLKIDLLWRVYGFKFQLIHVKN